MTWKDGDEVMGTGPSLEVKFKPGAHTITVVVDDGTDQVEESFTVIVKKEDESPGPGLVVALAAVVLAGLVMVRCRTRSPWWLRGRLQPVRTTCPMGGRVATEGLGAEARPFRYHGG